VLPETRFPRKFVQGSGAAIISHAATRLGQTARRTEHLSRVTEATQSDERRARLSKVAKLT
jgi:hypothetical protein